MDRKYFNYHSHRDTSNPTIADSPVTVMDYIERAKELGHTAISCVEHGVAYVWERTYLACEKHNMKFIYGVEGYILHTDDKVYHIILLAKNKTGMEDINELISEACISNFKNRRPRITLESLAQYVNPENVVCTTACTFGILNESTLELFEGLRKFFKDNFFLEVQPHNTDKQIQMNLIAKKLSEKYNIKLIGGNDSHYIYPHQKEEREDLIYSKRKIRYDDDDEAGWYMDYPDYDTMFQRFMDQGIWTEQEVFDLIERTNMVDDWDDIVICKDLRVPTLYPELTPEERKKKFAHLIDKKWNEYKEKNVPAERRDEYIREIITEMKEWFNCDMEDYALTVYEILVGGVKRGGVITTTGRGCFVANTQVLTMNGYKNIQDVVIGDTIINKFGKFDKVIHKLNYNISEKLTTIKSLGNKDITLTDDHKVYVYDSNLNDFYYIESKKIDKKVHFLTTPINAIGNKIKTKIYDLSNYSQDYFEEDVIYENIKGSQKEIRDIFSPTQMSEDKICGVVSNWKYRNNLIDENTDLYRTIYNYTKMNPSEYSEYLDKYNNTRTNRKDFFLKGNYICSKIKSVESTDVYNGLVYDLTIENDPSFMVENAIVHNSCSSFLTNMLLGFTTVDRLQAKVPILMPRFMTADKVKRGHTTPDTTLIK